MPTTDSQRHRSTQERDDPPPHIFEQVPRGAKPITPDDFESIPDAPDEIASPVWPIIRARVLLRELCKVKARGNSIPLYIIADLAFVASEDNHDHWISYWCRKLYPDLTADQLESLIENASPRSWDGDQIAGACDVTFKVKTELELEQIGCSDDYDGEKRRKYQKQRKAANSRAYRARNSTGQPPGRPPLKMTPEQKKAHRRQQQNESKRRCRGDKNPVTGIKTPLESYYREKSRNKCRHPSDDPCRVIYLSTVSISIATARTGSFDLRKAA